MSQGMLLNEIRERILKDEGYWSMNTSSSQMSGPQPGYPAQSVGGSVAAQTGEAVLSGERSFATVQYLPTGDPETELVAVILQFLTMNASQYFRDNPRRIASVLGYMTERYGYAAECQERQARQAEAWTQRYEGKAPEHTRLDELLRRMESKMGLVDKTSSPAGTSAANPGPSFMGGMDALKELEKLTPMRDPVERGHTATEVAEIERRQREYMLSAMKGETIR